MHTHNVLLVVVTRLRMRSVSGQLSPTPAFPPAMERGGSLLSLSLLLLLGVCSGDTHASFTIRVPPRKQQCFYEMVKVGSVVDVEYQVIQGGDLDIHFIYTEEDDLDVIVEPRSKQGKYIFTVTKTGEHSICLDNRFSRLAGKLVFLSLTVEDPDVKPLNRTEQNPVVRGMGLKLDAIQRRLEKVIFEQEFFRAREARHRHTGNSNNSRVQWWSAWEVVVILSAGMTQVLVIRRFFRSRRRDRIQT